MNQHEATADIANALSNSGLVHSVTVGRMVEGDAPEIVLVQTLWGTVLQVDVSVLMVPVDD